MSLYITNSAKISSYNCWWNINKPLGISSARVVSIVKRVTSAKKVGHGGTLDVFAEGVLPVALNRATKTSSEIISETKKYFFRITWGEFRDTDDVEGIVEEKSSKIPSLYNILSIVPSFIGNIEQTPSRFSAIKIGGKRAYQLARKGVDFSIKPRIVKIESIKILEFNDKFGDFEIKCSKGTYVRSLSRALCCKLEVCGFVSKLVRLQVGSFKLEKTISLDLLKLKISYGKSLLNNPAFWLQDVSIK